MKFGELTILQVGKRLYKCQGKSYKYYWLCQCSCGSKPKEIRGYNLTSGRTISCGCRGKFDPASLKATPTPKFLGFDNGYKVNRKGEVFGKNGGKLHSYLMGGYPVVRLGKNGKYPPVHIHTLVAATFIGKRPKGLCTCHRDSNSVNCHASNLYYGTHEQNGKDAANYRRKNGCKPKTPTQLELEAKRDHWFEENLNLTADYTIKDVQKLCKPVPNFLNYYCDELGRVFSTKSGEVRLLKPGIMSKDYYSYMLYRNGKQVEFLAQRLILQTFIGPSKPGQEARHLNGDRSDNQLENLKWGTHLENQRDSIGRNKNYKLTKEDISEIRKMKMEGHKPKEIGEKFNVTGDCIRRILRGDRWKDV